MKNNLVILSTLFCLPLTSYGMFQSIGREIDQEMRTMHSRMEMVFEELTERTAATKIEAPDYSVRIQEDGASIILSIALDESITSDAIAVEVDGDELEVVVDGKDKLTITVSGQRMNSTVKKSLEREQKDKDGHVYAVSTGSAIMSQSQMLPERVDFSKAPTADLSNGILQITLAKKVAQKIAVTTSQPQEQKKSVTENRAVDGQEAFEEDIENLK